MASFYVTSLDVWQNQLSVKPKQSLKHPFHRRCPLASINHFTLDNISSMSFQNLQVPKSKLDSEHCSAAKPECLHLVVHN